MRSSASAQQVRKRARFGRPVSASWVAARRSNRSLSRMPRVAQATIDVTVMTVPSVIRITRRPISGGGEMITSAVVMQTATQATCSAAARVLKKNTAYGVAHR